jgi:hypothetical protein
VTSWRLERLTRGHLCVTCGWAAPQTYVAVLFFYINWWPHEMVQNGGILQNFAHFQ